MRIFDTVVSLFTRRGDRKPTGASDWQAEPEIVHPLKPWTNPPPPPSTVFEQDESRLEKTPGESLRSAALLRTMSDTLYPETAPRLFHNGELIEIDDAFVPVMVEGIYGRDRESVSWTVKAMVPAKPDPRQPNEPVFNRVTVPGIPHYSEAVLKYSNNCRDYTAYDPGAREYDFQQTAYALGVGLKTIFESPPTKLVDRRTFKTDFDMPPEEYNECALNKYSTIRFVVMERITTTLADYIQVVPDFRFTVAKTLDVFDSIISKVEILHKNGILHRRLGLHSIGFLSNNEIRFDDFRNAAYAADFFEIDEKLPTSATSAEPDTPLRWMSPFELDNYRTSFRDEAFRVFWIAAGMMCGKPFFTYVTSLGDDRRKLIDFKTSGLIFDPEFCPDIAFEKKYGINHPRLIKQLYRIRTTILSTPDIDEMPNYAEISRLTKKIRNLMADPDAFTMSGKLDKVLEKFFSAFDGFKKVSTN